MRHVETHRITGDILIESGLHIGGTREEIGIGTVDLPIIKDPRSQEPYIPGSSLKGKMRSSLELHEGRFSENGEPCGCGHQGCLICRIFGTHKAAGKNELGPTRIMVRDALLTPSARDERKKILSEGRPYLEHKTEHVNNRRTQTAEHPRTLERVPPGCAFGLEIGLRIFEQDKSIEKQMLQFIAKGLDLVEDSYLGGFGSRGSGKVRFVNIKLNGSDWKV